MWTWQRTTTVTTVLGNLTQIGWDSCICASFSKPRAWWRQFNTWKIKSLIVTTFVWVITVKIVPPSDKKRGRLGNEEMLLHHSVDWDCFTSKTFQIFCTVVSVIKIINLVLGVLYTEMEFLLQYICITCTIYQYIPECNVHTYPTIYNYMTILLKI